MPAQGFLPALVEWARANDVVFIADEVQTGFGRTGAWFASDHEGIVPDLVVTAKGIAGGLPLSAVTGRAEIMDSAMAGGLGGTYGGNPLACAAALATIDAYEQDGLIERAREIGAVLLGRLNALRTADARIGDVRGRGAMVAIELVDPATGAPDAALTNAVAKYAHAERRDPAHLRHLRQRHPLPPPAHHLRRTAHRRPLGRRGRTEERMTDLLAATTMSTATDAAPGSANTVDAHIATPLTDARAQLAEAIGLLGYETACTRCSRPRAASSRSPCRCGSTRVRAGSTSATACSTTSRAAPRRAACATRRTSTSTRCARSRCG